MKILHSKSNGAEASVLLMTVVITTIVGFLLIAYLTLVKSQNYSTFRSQAWNNAIPVIEAGIEDALAHLNKENGTNDLAGDGGWVKTGDLYYMKRYVGESYYIVTISNYVVNASNVTPVVESRAYVTMPLLVASAQNYLFAQAGGTPVSTVSYLARGVRVKAKQDRLFSKGMVADGEIDLNGNRITTDSFDSTDTNYNSGGRYDINKRRANGDIASNVGLTNSAAISSDNAQIYGRMSTGPQGSVDIGPNGSVGDLAWHAAGRKGIQSGYLKDDMNVDFSTISAPGTSGFSINGTSQTINGTNYDYVLSGGSGTLYSADELKLSSQTMLIQGTVTLYVQNDLAISGSGSIQIAPGATLNLYVAAPAASIGGNGVINQGGSALNFTYWGLPSNTQLTFGGNADFIGLIYAPQADFTLNGGGGNVYYDFSGASITKTVKMGGNYNFHYDEALRKIGPPKGFIVTSWDEMTPAEVAAAPVN